MNYLAHALLSSHSPAAIVGGLLGDFVKGSVPAYYDAEIRAAILMHRAIDRYTDAHELHRASRALVSPERRRFAGILVDVFYDHFLVRHWTRFSAQPLSEFTQSIYAALQSRHGSLPERLQSILPHMAGDDWLGSYGDLDAVHAALHGIARRFSRFPRAAVLLDGIEELENNYTALEQQFLEFFPQVERFAREQVGGETWELRRTGSC
jgi:acyl carrier protein phosphodiesterase